MTVFIKDIPTLSGKQAERFLKSFEDNKHKQIDFSKEYINSINILNKKDH